MLILICGSRDWTDRKAVEREIKAHNFDPKVDVIMHGAAKGADTCAWEIAMRLGFKVLVFKAEWDRYNKAAGPFRNQKMLDQNPDLVLAFHPNINISKGTRHMVKIAREKGVRVEVFEK